MNTHLAADLPDPVRAAVDDLLPIVRRLADGEYAVSVGGSIGKGTSDARSDVDLRLFCEDRAPKREFDAAWTQLMERIAYWRTNEVEVDECWVRRIGDIGQALKEWGAGTAEPVPLVWTLWGYHLPTDIYNQYPIEDEHGVLRRLQALLTPYPPALKQAIIHRHSRSLRYWSSDYHYRNKVHRSDVVFLGSIAPRLVHDMLQILYALGETYYPGDGKNLELLPKSVDIPAGFRDRIRTALYPGSDPDALERQWKTLNSLAADVLAIADASGLTQPQSPPQ
jgi:hypothetical protein